MESEMVKESTTMSMVDTMKDHGKMDKCMVR